MSAARLRPFSIRTKLLLIALALLLFPWLGYRYVHETKAFVRAGQEQALLLTARAVATVLHDRPELFARDDPAPAPIGAQRHLYAYPLPHPMRAMKAGRRCGASFPTSGRRTTWGCAGGLSVRCCFSSPANGSKPAATR